MNTTAEKLNLVYTLDGKIYINLTNKCSNNCLFCIRRVSEEIEGKNLWLKSEDFTSKEVIEQFEDVFRNNSTAKEVVFCGFGEPLIKLDLFLEVAKYLKENYQNIKIRINTNGQANLIHGRNVIPEISKYTDAISVSLNAESKEVYNHCSQPKDKENAYAAVKEFIKDCVKNNIKTTATVVSGYKDAPVDTEECRKIANSLGAEFRVREWLPKGY